MPWKETGPMAERTTLVRAGEHDEDSRSVLRARFGISLKTGYKWWNRYQA